MTTEGRLSAIEATCRATHKALDERQNRFEKTVEANFKTINDSLNTGHEEFKRMREAMNQSNHLMELHCSNGGHHCLKEDEKSSLVIKITSFGKPVAYMGIILTVALYLIDYFWA